MLQKIKAELESKAKSPRSLESFKFISQGTELVPQNRIVSLPEDGDGDRDQ
jgi:hypothetical protein